MQDAESSDQSWMQPETPKKLPVAGYSEFNPPPQLRPIANDQPVDYTRKIYRFLVGAAIGSIVGLVLYIVLVHFA
jgi:hypothetical protein